MTVLRPKCSVDFWRTRRIPFDTIDLLPSIGISVRGRIEKDRAFCVLELVLSVGEFSQPGVVKRRIIEFVDNPLVDLERRSKHVLVDVVSVNQTTFRVDEVADVNRLCEFLNWTTVEWVSLCFSNSRVHFRLEVIDFEILAW